MWKARASPVLIAAMACLFLVWGSTSQASGELSSATLGPADSRLNVKPTSVWYSDPSGAMTVEEVHGQLRAGAFLPFDEQSVSLVPSRNTVWLYLRVENDRRDEDCVLEVGNPRMPEVDFYVVQPQGHYRHTVAGTARPYYDRQVVFLNSALKLEIPTGEVREIFVRVSNTGDMRFRLGLWAGGAFFNHAMTTVISNVLMSGLLLALVAFHLVVCISIRELSHLYLTLFLSAWLLWYLAFTGTGSLLLWSDAPTIAARAPTLFVYLVCATFAIFSNALLEVPKYAPRWSYGMLVYAGVCVLGIVISVATDSTLRIYGAIFVAAAGPFLMAGVALRVIGRGGRSARLFLLTWVLVHIGGITVIVLSAYFVRQQGFGANWLNLIVVLSTLLWSFDLTGRVKTREREQRRLLEERVEERTRDLKTALSEVKHLSGLLPICASCKKIRDDQGYWNSVEQFFAQRTDAIFSHGICPECQERLYPELSDTRLRDAEERS
jgi:hypothetical protein